MNSRLLKVLMCGKGTTSSLKCMKIFLPASVNTVAGVSSKRGVAVKAADGNSEPVDERMTVNNKDDENRGLTADKPFLVASPTNKCIVGCTCSPKHPTVNWFYVTEGSPQTCNCGYFFQLMQTGPKDWIPEYSRIMHVDDKRIDLRLHPTKDMPFKAAFTKKLEKIPHSMSKLQASDKKLSE